MIMTNETVIKKRLLMEDKNKLFHIEMASRVFL